MKMLLFLSILTMSLTSLAGFERGNGGYSVVCRENGSKKGRILEAELLDIYEGALLYKRRYSKNQKSEQQYIKEAFERISGYAYFAQKLQKEIEYVNANKVSIPDGHELTKTEDAFPAVKKKGCNWEQLANYTNSGEVLVSQEIYDYLDDLNKAALTLHEAIYSIRRKSLDEKTSQNTRRFVAHLLADVPDQAFIERFAAESLHSVSQRKRPCGLEGSIEERIESCSYLVQPIFHLVLVMKTPELKEVWFDPTTKLLWGDRLPEYFSYQNAEKACQGDLPEMGHLDFLDWRLPKITDFSPSENALIMLPNMSTYSNHHWFWTSTVKGRSVMTINGDGTVGYNMFTRSLGSVRCVAPLK